MSLQNSPSLKDFSEGYQPPPDSEKGKKRVRIILGAFSLLLLAMLVVNFIQSDIAEVLSQKGSISGNAVSESGNPIQVEVLVFGTDIKILSDENGFFNIESVPAGEQEVIVAYGNIATEVNVSVTPGKENSLETIIVPTELLISVDE